ncbi:MAG: hypothetical protein KatS3mg026_0854 [Bacteroidia bacterium]|nr:MAG: hypothetical protein KatS3mg026_0854 [Bacteroidia bacterium]
MNRLMYLWLVRKQLWAMGGLLLIGIGGRLLPHPPNFTPLEALALYSGAWIRPWWAALAVPLTVMALTDALLGWHALWPFTWGGMLAGVFLGRWLLQPGSWYAAAGLGLTQSTLFFLLSNFGVWLQGHYGYTFAGLLACYLAAIPFFHYQALGALTYTTLGWLIERYLFPILQARVSAA